MPQPILPDASILHRCEFAPRMRAARSHSSCFIPGCMGLVLARQSGSDRVFFGYMTANRDAEFEGMSDLVGPLANMLLCRIDAAYAATDIKRVLRATQDDILNSLPHQHSLMGTMEPNWKSVRSWQYMNARDDLVDSLIASDHDSIQLDQF
ncbi:hypothetical protein B0I35DRAFT_425760 [Stachybotrys elegans]|uniref:Condensation domain-containing protein n=1 Tax=Stachybotrys elegans TaxID=80388 RepID=A0A8K0SYH3_9HYPO|nr:hypothetical protein B0I35DRAFT_425760 [Stachybotrys elegans]